VFAVPIRRDVVAIGASAGGVETLRSLVGSLPADFPAAVLVTMHLAAESPSALPQILDRAGPLSAVPASHGAKLTPGTIHVAPPDQHLLTEDGALVLSRGPTENGHRPAVNATFRSVAVTSGAKAVGVILSGSLDDGALGLRAIVDRGGAAVVQDPEEALYRGMPENALARVDTAHVHTADLLGKALDELVRRPVDDVPVEPPSATLLLDDRIARDGVQLDAVTPAPPTSPSAFTCPDCHGTLLQIDQAEEHYRCRIGHGWSAEALLASHDLELQRALGTALRSLNEKVALAERLQRDVAPRGLPVRAARHRTVARESAKAAEELRRFLLSLTPEAGPRP
jgi:two-component system chemotaxis response regulator CheB